MKFRYKIIILFTAFIIFFNLISGFVAYRIESENDRELFGKKIGIYNSLIRMVNAEPLQDSDAGKVRKILELIYTDTEVVSVSIINTGGTIALSMKKNIQNNVSILYSYSFNIMKGGEKLREARIEYSDIISRARLSGLITERIFLTLGLILFNAAVVLLISGYLLRPVTLFVNGLQKINDGDFKFRVNTGILDEFKLVEEYFNNMVESLDKETQSRIEKEDQLVEVYKYLGTVFNSIPFVLITVDMDGIVNQWNYAAVKFTGVSSSDAINKSVWRLVPILEEYKPAFNSVIRGETGEVVKLLYVSAEKDKFINISISPLVSDKSNGAVIRMEDVTETKLKDEKLSHAQMMDTIGNLAGALAHDFNNVLGGITSTVSLIKFRMHSGDDPEPDEMKKFLDIMENSGIRAVELTKQILSLSRKEELNFIPAELNQIIKQVIELCRHTLDKSVEISFDYFKLAAPVLADPVRLEQVLLNLCINACHSMTVMRTEGEPWGGQIVINIEKHIADEFFCNSHEYAYPGVGYWQISVKDNGVGIERKNIKKIFEPFFTTKTKGNGTGLGLSMSYNIIRQHNGFIDVYSEQGAGSTFYIYIPANDAETEDKIITEKKVIKGGGLILLIDDEKSMCETASAMLNIIGYDVISAYDPVKGLELFKENHKSIKAVLLDMIMPKKTGVELFEIFRGIDPLIPVVITSGFSIDDNFQKILNERKSSFIQKPFSMESLANAIEIAVNS